MNKTRLTEEQRKQNQKKHSLKRAHQGREFINKMKVELGCWKCGYNEAPEALDFDHQDPTQKKYSVSRMVTYSKHKILQEIAKCLVLCANCHRVKTKRDANE